jgi:hypothetical protein
MAYAEVGLFIANMNTKGTNAESWDEPVTRFVSKSVWRKLSRLT